jgi:pimeloyl-ACP methyl ester carboxylesterase
MPEGAATVIYVHGIGNQPPADALKRQWDIALFGRDMGARTRMAYWVNRRRYPRPAPAGRILPLPPGLADWVAEQATSAVLPDVHDFLFHPARRRSMTRPLRLELGRGPGPFIVIAHSQGSMIAYDVLRRLGPATPAVALFVTLGSPLGLTEVRRAFCRWAGRKAPRVPASVRRWLNVADRLDAVAADARLSDDFDPAGFIEDRVRMGLNKDAPLAPHSASGYLRAAAVRRAVRLALSARGA